MMFFAIASAMLAALGLGVLTWPLWRRANDAAPSDALSPASVAVLRQQLQQLQSLHEGGTLGTPAYQEARAGLERRVVDAVFAAAPDAAAAWRPDGRRRLALWLSLAVLGLAVAGYAWLGTPAALSVGDAPLMAAAPGGSHAVTSEQIEAMVERLAARLKAQPDDADGWAMLGRSQQVLGRHDDAMQAFRRALQLRGDDASLLADAADALAMVNGRRLDGEPAQLVARALELDADNPKALSLAGTIAFDRKDFAAAIRHWERMQRVAPQSELTRQAEAGIDEARLRLGGAAPPPAPPATAAPATLSGTVTLARTLADKARPDDTVFVFARAAEGPRMPLAIVRKQVRDLPFAFTLDDSQAMSPGARLSSAARVVVGARISKGGGATPQPGDLEGFSSAVAPGASQLKIEIAEVVR